MPWWIELPAYLLASLACAWALVGLFSLPGVADFFERNLVGPIGAILVLCTLWAFLEDPNLHTLHGLASFLHNDAGY